MHDCSAEGSSHAAGNVQTEPSRGPHGIRNCASEERHVADDVLLLDTMHHLTSCKRLLAIDCKVLNPRSRCIVVGLE